MSDFNMLMVSIPLRPRTMELLSRMMRLHHATADSIIRTAVTELYRREHQATQEATNVSRKG